LKGVKDATAGCLGQFPHLGGVRDARSAYLAGVNIWNVLFLAAVVEGAWYGIKLVRFIFKYELDR
jgi:hypothetical protein